MESSGDTYKIVLGEGKEDVKGKERLREMALEVVRNIGFGDAMSLLYEEAMRVSPMGTTRKG